MKKLLISIISCFLALVTYAQSTCETRVDAHQKATTKQRVAYCLTPDAAVADDTYSRLVFAGVSNAQPPTMQTVQQQRVTAKPGRFKQENVTISQTYVATNQFPQVMQGDAEQPVEVIPLITDEQATQPVLIETPAYSVGGTPEYEDRIIYVSSPTVPSPVGQDPQLGDTQQGVGLRPEHFMINEVDAQGRLLQQQTIRETRTGLKARQSKPGRNLKQANVINEQEESAQTEQSEQLADTSYTDLAGAQSDMPDTIGGNDMYEEIPVEGTQAPATSK